MPNQVAFAFWELFVIDSSEMNKDLEKFVDPSIYFG